MKQFIQQKIAAIKKTPAIKKQLEKLRQRILPEVEKFLIAGPALVGFVLGILRYKPGSVAFETAFQSLFIFTTYLAALLFVQVLDSLFFSAWPLVLGVMRSFLATIYLVVTLRQYWQWRRQIPQTYGLVRSLRAYLRPLVGDAS